jgi:asparagine synthase (glutamine-hydrolysing)
LFAFGSEIKALLSLQEVPRKLNERALLYYLIECLNDKEQTFYQAIFRLPPAHAMTVSRESARLWQYWQLDREREISFKNDDDYVDGFRDIFFEVVRCRMRSAAPLGVLLSGGLDSSSVACVARLLQDNSGQGPIKAFSGIFPGLPQEQRRQVDERAYLERVTSQGGFDTHLLRADLLSPLAGLEEILWLHDEPVVMRGHYFYQALLKTAHDQGVRAMLDGCEGDVAVSYGYLKFTELATAGRWKAFADLAHLVSQNCMTQNRNYPPSLAFWRYGFEALANSGSARTWNRFAGQLNDVATSLGISRWHLMKRLAREKLRRRRGHASYPWSSLSLVNSQFIKRIGLPEDVSVRLCTQREGHIQALESGQLSHTLEVTDKLSVAHGIEPRHPFFDRRLLEYCVALPSEQIFYGGWQRAILRRALEGVLPPQVQRRLGKSDHGVNVAYNFLKYEQSRIDSLLLCDFDIIYPYVDLRGLREAYRRYTIQPTMIHLMPLRRIVVLSAWLQQAW